MDDILEALPDAVWIVDDEGRCLDANRAGLQLFDASRERIGALSIDSLQTASGDSSEAAWNRFLVAGELDDVFILTRADSTRVALHVRARARAAPGRHVCVFRRCAEHAGSATMRPAFGLVSTLLRVEEEILAPEMSLETVMNVICERAAVLTSADGSVIEVQDGDELVYAVTSGSMSRFVGVRIAAAGSLSGLALHTRSVLACEDTEIDARVDRVACRKVGVRSMVVVPLEHDGELVGVLKVASALPRAFGPDAADLLRLLAGFMANAMVRASASDTRRALEHRQKERLVELERLREETTALLVHDMKSPLSAVTLNLEFLRSELPVERSEAVSAALDALNATHRLNALISTLLDVARLEQGSLELRPARFDVAPLVEEVLSERRIHAKTKDVRLVSEVEATIEVHADRTLVRRVLDNVVDNALRYTPVGGRIEITATAGDSVAEVRIGNTGSAIATDERRLIFEKFAGKGGLGNCGLGLYFCKLVAQAHGGDIWIESSEFLPTVFVIALPIRPAASRRLLVSPLPLPVVDGCP